MKHPYRPVRILITPILVSAILTVPASAISFTNFNLDGTVSTAALPTDWEKVPFDVSYSEASSDNGTNGDVVSASGPNVAGGIFGLAHSGTTFFGGAHSLIAGNTLQEGIQQTLIGFTVGQQYTFSFYQANVGTTGSRDTEGSWRVYADGSLISTTVPTATSLAWDDAAKATDLVWEQRTVTFTAAAESITLSFLAYDQDGVIGSQGGAYMGIDTFSEITAVPEPSVAALGLIAGAGLLRRRRK